ncbi:uncharacterized protein LOC133201967 [Saccostrea echinata]|uniref:uncharacterized protein LOC133201967 n=1 Tax=Saccostrea echinata TaxID=191078 RepID=UPI002A82192D|nr:uncharacterized protein LOC133201967 [Saccostrea echinata]
MFAKEWREFNETGELTDTLLSAVWEMNNKGYIEHKNEILPYMQKLGLLADMGEQHNKWYVPCMNKIPFPASSFTEYPASSILCYEFDVLPAGIFHRLVATCIQIPWEFFSDEDRGCIYQTVAIFVFPDLHHNIMVGMTKTDIQLQVFVTEGEVDVSTCHQIRDRIESILHNLSNTFQNNSGFHVAFKCKPAGFCDSKESAVIKESKFTRATFQCPSCPARKKHKINSSDVTKYWKQEQQKKDVDKEGKLESPAERLERTPTDKELLMVSRHIGAIFQLIGIGLEVDSATVEQIKIDYQSQGVRTQIFKILDTWRKKEGRQATVRKLLEVIKDFRGEVDFGEIERVFNP